MEKYDKATTDVGCILFEIDWNGLFVDDQDKRQTLTLVSFEYAHFRIYSTDNRPQEVYLASTKEFYIQSLNNVWAMLR